MVFGRMRASSSSPECLERLPSKLLKENSLSIYEATLVRLKQGSQRDLSSSLKNAEPETASTLCSSCSESTKREAYVAFLNTSKDSSVGMTEDSTAIDSANSGSTESSKLLNKKNVSILYLFAKYNNSQQII